MRLVIFDLDGTLINSVKLNVETIEGAFADAGQAAPSEKIIRSISGIVLADAMRILAPGANPAQVAVIADAYRARYRASEGKREPLFEGALAALDRLGADPETILAVATGKGHSGAVTLLERHGIAGRFHSIETPTHNRGKPDPQMVETAMAKAGIGRAATVMVGDTVHDMRMAKSAGVKALGVAWGYHEVDELREAGADVVIDRFDQLDGAVAQLLREWPMREFLDDAHAHRDAGVGRAQPHDRRELPKRFYKAATVKPVDGGFAVGLDGRVPKTPGMKQVVVPFEAVAQAMAEEWAAQGEFIDPRTMPMTRLINSAVEAGENSTPALREEIVKYAANDLLLYRADNPDVLVQRQEQHWDAALVKLARHFGVAFQPTIGIVHQPQPATTLARLGTALDGEALLPLTALNAIVSITGSGLLAIGLRAGLLDAEQVWAAAHVDEDHNVAMWGEVEEIIERRAKRRMEFDAATRLLTLLG